jgi:hypothetical protein
MTSIEFFIDMIVSAPPVKTEMYNRNISRRVKAAGVKKGQPNRLHETTTFKSGNLKFL